MVELLVIIAMVAMVAVLAAATTSRFLQKSHRIGCISRLKQIGLSVRIFATDHGERFPFEVAATNGGSREWAGQPLSLYRHFLTMSNYLSTPLVLICPADATRKMMTSWEAITNNERLSFFLGLDATESRPQMVLVGDRNILVDHKLPANQIIPWTTNSVAEYELKTIHRGAGNVGLADGSVQQLTSSRLMDQLKHAETNTFRLGFP